MTPFQQRQIAKGASLVLFGAFYAGYAATSLPIGTPTSPEAGMFPLIIGSALVMFGALFAGPALLQAWSGGGGPASPSRSIWREFDIGAFSAVLGAIASFAITVAWFGLAPAIVVMTAVAALGNRKITPLMVLVLSCIYVATTYLVFMLGLGLSLDLWKWPF